MIFHGRREKQFTRCPFFMEEKTVPKKKIIDRDTYRAIKKMSREELQAFLMRYADGLLEKDGKSIDLREVEKDLRQIKGIGDKRVEEIMAVFEKHLGL